MPGKSAFQAIIEGKCPKCRKGDMFAYAALNYTKFDKMHTHCPHCKFRFEVEPGFFIGAMYISYGMVVGLMIGVGLFFFYAFGDPPTWVYLIAFPAMVVLLLPFIFRYSRILYLYAFGSVSYNQNL